MDLEAELLKSLSRDELEGRIAERIKSFHGFLTREVALRLIARDMGLLKSEERAYRLADIPKGEKRITFRAKVRKIWPIASYSSGKRSRVVEVSDDTGTRPLVLWNEDVGIASGLRLKDEIDVRGAYEKGGELHLGYSGSVAVSERAGFSELPDLGEGDAVHVRGFVKGIEGQDRFVRRGREETGFSFMLTDGQSERRCVIFEGLGRAGRLQPGDEVVIEGGVVEKGNITLDAQARLLYRRSSGMLLGEVKGLECSDDTLIAEVGERRISLDRQNALRFLGVDVADDIALSTVVSLKKDKLLNNRIAVKIEEKDGQIVVRC
jgi:hypothetical protein